MTRTFAVIPVRNQVVMTMRLLACLLAEPVDDVLIMDNGSIDDTVPLVRAARRYRKWRGRLHLTNQRDASIYGMWNFGFKRAARIAKRDPFNVLVLNNDIDLRPGWVDALAHALRADDDRWVTYPDYHAPWDATPTGTVTITRGVCGDGGMFGPCFMLAGDRLPWRPLVTDLGYRWWWGDNHLAECIEQEGGLQARVNGLPILHVNEATAQHHPELAAQKFRDRAHWIDRYNRAPRAIDRR